MTHVQGHPHDVHEPEQGNMTGYAAIKYTAVIIVVLAILAFLVWAIGQFT
jgi:hypothetical protein